MNIDRLMQATARSMYLSAKVMPANMRPAFSVAYLLGRAADSIADTSLLPGKDKLQKLRDFPGIIQNNNIAEMSAIKELIVEDAENNSEKKLLERLPYLAEQYHALKPKEQEMIMEVLKALCLGMEKDVLHFPEEDGVVTSLAENKDLDEYCFLMGGMPGIFWSRLILEYIKNISKHQEFISQGEKVGKALQITNILRDIPGDYKINRCYLPLESLGKHGVVPFEILEEKNKAKLGIVIKDWTRYGVENLREIKNYYASIPKRHIGVRAAVAWPALWSAESMMLMCRNVDAGDTFKKTKISKTLVYVTFILTPFFLVSNTLFKIRLERILSGCKL